MLADNEKVLTRTKLKKASEEDIKRLAKFMRYDVPTLTKNQQVDIILWAATNA